ncbi:MAG: cobalamin biosynthesis protein [Candidatus Methanomethylophilaceae archaeon]|nr:cobalamin biosynthesis protein [Candidatus Methanomethylophilaceae archaeon]
MRINAIAFSTNGCRTAIRLKEAFPEEDLRIFAKTQCDTLGVERIEEKASVWTGRSFEECDAIVFIGAIGIAVRYIAPYIKAKTIDPAVIGMDEHGRWTVALLAGHIGGANALTARIAERLGSEPIITTATDLNGKFSVDTFATVNNLRIMGLRTAQDVSVRVLDNAFVGFTSELPVQGELPAGLTSADSGEFGVSISTDIDRKPFDTTMRLVPMDIILGVGCKRDTDPEKMKAFVSEILAEDGIPAQRIGAVCSVDLKKDEAAILELAKNFRVPSKFYTSEELMELEGEFTKSDFVKSITSVDCVCERSSIRPYGGEIIRRKTAKDGMTIAICRRPMELRFL